MPFPNSEFLRQTIQKYFKKRKVEYTEDGFLSVINNQKSGKFDVYWAVLGLRDVGTEKSIDPLKKLLYYPMQDVKDCSILTICHIAGEKETEYYASALLDKKTKKHYPMWAIYDCGNELATDAVIEYITSVYKKWKQPNCEYAGDAYLEGLLYLDRFSSDNDKVIKIFNLYKEIKHKLPEGAVKRIRGETKMLKDIFWGNK